MSQRSAQYEWKHHPSYSRESVLLPTKCVRHAAILFSVEGQMYQFIGHGCKSSSPCFKIFEFTQRSAKLPSSQEYNILYLSGCLK